ncbi:MAG: DNA ligase [Zoogloea sp.]|nr:DNA ligase [Zoogloea sp.]
MTMHPLLKLAVCALLAGVGALSPATGQEAAGAPPILLAEVYRSGIDPSRYWVSEKYDGVRALWDGSELRFRSGRPVHAPAWFIAGLPPVPLDGELWMGRRSFERLSGVVRKEQPVDAEWRQVRYMVFELPGAAGTFSARIARMRELVAAAGVPWLHAVEQFRVGDRTELQRRMDEVVRNGGEGLMLHLAEAPYLTGRSEVLLKLKPWLDTEATVVAHLPGRGKYAGLLGALEVETPQGRRFRIGTGFSDAVRRAPPPVGAVITYRYRELTADGTPRFASYLRLRETF